MGRGRTVSFMVLTDERIVEIRQALLDYAEKQYKHACQLGIDKHVSLDEFMKITGFQIDGHIECLKALNHAMNTMADFANSNNIAVPGSLLFQMQAFLNAIMSTEFSVAAKRVGMLSDVALNDIGGCFMGALEASFRAHEKLEEEDLSSFEKLSKRINDDSYPVEEVVSCFKEDLSTWTTNELVRLCAEIPNLLKLGKVLSLVSPGSKRTKRLDNIIMSIEKISQEEIARRRESN